MAQPVGPLKSGWLVTVRNDQSLEKFLHVILCKHFYTSLSVCLWMAQLDTQVIVMAAIALAGTAHRAENEAHSPRMCVIENENDT